MNAADEKPTPVEPASIEDLDPQQPIGEAAEAVKGGSLKEMFQMLSNISKAQNETIKAIAQNVRG